MDLIEPRNRHAAPAVVPTEGLSAALIATCPLARQVQPGCEAVGNDDAGAGVLPDHARRSRRRTRSRGVSGRVDQELETRRMQRRLRLQDVPVVEVLRQDDWPVPWGIGLEEATQTLRGD